MDGKYLLLLTIILMVYLCLGAGLFSWTEKSKEEDTKRDTFLHYSRFLNNNTCVTADELHDLIDTIIATSADYGGFDTVKKTENSTSTFIWDFTGAFTFCVTVVTTIGYGHTHPVTFIGKIICIVYALIGIPLALIVLGGIGDKLSLLGQKLHRLELNADSPGANKYINMVLLIGGGLLVMFIIPSAVFTSLEGWNIIDSVYFCFATLSTIGFGDYVAGVSPVGKEPFTTIYRIAVYVWIFIGLSYIALIINFISKILVQRAEQIKKKALKTVGNQNFDFMNGIRNHMNGISGAGENNNEGDEYDEDKEKHNGEKEFNPPPITKCKVNLKDIIDLKGTNDHGIKLTRVSYIKT